MTNVLVVGLGETGKPLMDILQQSYTVYGRDVEPVLVNAPIEVMHICYPFVNQTQFLAISANYASQYRPNLIIINATVLPGTTTQLAQITNCAVAYSPIRGKHVKMHEDLMKYVKFVAGATDEATGMAQEHFQSAGFQAKTMNKPEALELAKLVETSYLGVLVAWAQEIERYAHKLEADYYEIMKFTEEINYLPPVIFRPGFIGGHCVMPNLDLLSQVMPGEIASAIQRSNALKAAELQERGEQPERVTPVSRR